jgi:hypothetical protein
MAQLSSLLFGSAALLGLVYVGLALASMRHIPSEKKTLLSSRLPVFFFWWPFYRDLYAGSVGGLRAIGIVVFLAMVSIYIFWFAVPHGNA